MICTTCSLVRQERPVLLGPHEVAVKSLAYNLMGRVEESFSFYADWTAEGKRPGKEETIEAAKRIGHCRLWLRC